VKTGVVDALQMRSALAKQRISGEDVLEVLLRNRMVSEEDLAQGLGSFYKYKVVDIHHVTPKVAALQYSDGDFCRRHLILPFGLDRHTGDLLVAVADPSRAVSALDALQSKTGVRVRPYVAPRQALSEAIASAYGASEGRGVQRAATARFEVSSLGSVPSFSSSGAGMPASKASLSSLSNSWREQSGEVGSFFDSRPHSGGLGPGASNLFGERRDAVSAASFGAPDPLFGGGGDRKSASSSLFDDSSLGANAGNADVAELRRENLVLRQQISRLEGSLQLEINLVRQIVELLLERGVIDRAAYLERMARLR